LQLFWPFQHRPAAIITNRHCWVTQWDRSWTVAPTDERKSTRTAFINAVNDAQSSAPSTISIESDPPPFNSPFMFAKPISNQEQRSGVERKDDMFQRIRSSASVQSSPPISTTPHTPLRGLFSSSTKHTSTRLNQKPMIIQQNRCDASADSRSSYFTKLSSYYHPPTASVTTYRSDRASDQASK
jgi:hypothetical protein